jgi:hypothetical protein
MSLFNEDDTGMKIDDVLSYIEGKYGLDHRQIALEALENHADFE